MRPVSPMLISPITTQPYSTRPIALPFSLKRPRSTSVSSVSSSTSMNVDRAVGGTLADVNLSSMSGLPSNLAVPNNSNIPTIPVMQVISKPPTSTLTPTKQDETASMKIVPKLLSIQKAQDSFLNLNLGSE